MDRDLLGIRRLHSPLASSSCFRSARSASSRDVLESVCMRYTLGEVHQIWEVRREVTMSGLSQVSQQRDITLFTLFCSPPMSACSHCRKHLPFCQMLLSFSLSFFTIYQLFVPTQRMPASDSRVTGNLVRFWDFHSQTWWQPAPIQTVLASHGEFLAFHPEHRNSIWGLDTFSCTGELFLYHRKICLNGSIITSLLSSNIS